MSIRSLLGLVVVSAATIGAVPGAAGAGGAFALPIGHDMPSWSPDGSRIAFVGFRNGRLGDIYTMTPDERDELRLTATEAHEDMPRWSPDGTRIAFVGDAGGGAGSFQIFVMNADGTARRQVTRGGPPNFSPSWSPDGTRIVFVSNRDRNSEIYVVDADGSAETRLTNNARQDDSPDWSPDGRLIAFASNRTESLAWRLFVMRPDGTDVRPLTNDPADFHSEQRPVWSPDGRNVAFVTTRDPPVDNTEIYAVDADGTNIRRLTRSDHAENSPTWSPDGRRIALSRSIGALRPEIYVMSAEGGTARKLTGGRIRFVRMTRSPGGPRAGRVFTVELTVRPPLTRFADVACYAAVRRVPLDVVFGGVVEGWLRCAWHIPRAARGRRVYGFVGTLVGHTQVARTFSHRAR